VPSPYFDFFVASASFADAGRIDTPLKLPSPICWYHRTAIDCCFDHLPLCCREMNFFPHRNG
jgi:hypothetical protein